MILYPSAEIRIRASEELETVASILSAEVFSGIPFGGRSLQFFDEVPAVRLEGFPMGLFIALSGYPGEYILQIKPTPETLKSFADLQSSPHQIGNYVAACVLKLGKWKVETFAS